MKEVIIETIIDSIKLLPFLFFTFIFIEFVEHKLNNKKIVTKAGQFGPIVGGILGAVPQCGFSVSATNLFATKIISMGTLIAIYLSTSDEMLPILLSGGVSISEILKIIGIKLLIGIICGIIVDLIFGKKNENINVSELCEDEHCHCEKGIIISSSKHTINIFVYILIFSFVLNTIFHFVGEENLSKIFMNNVFIGPFICSLFGLIPNCAPSVILTQLYLTNTITLGTVMSGLLTGSGLAIMVLFKTNKNIKENIKILSIVYIVGVLSGIMMNLINL